MNADADIVRKGDDLLYDKGFDSLGLVIRVER